MGRRKIEIKAIKDDRNRSVTFLKRKGGLFKKAHELSVLCSVDVAVIVFGNNKKLYEYSSIDMRELIARYQYHGGPSEHKGPSDFNGGAHDDDDDDDADGTPPRGLNAIDSHILPPHFQGHPQPPPPPPFPQVRHHTASVSPPMANGPFQSHQPHMSRGHTPQPPIASRPSSRNDMRQIPLGRGGMAARQPVATINGPHPGMTYMTAPPPMYSQTSSLIPPGPTYGYQPHQPPQQAPFIDERRPSAPPTFPSQQAPVPQSIAAGGRAHPSASPPQPIHHQPPSSQIHHLSPQPERRHLEVQHPPPPPPPPPPLQPRDVDRSKQPFPSADMTIKKLPQRKSHSIFTPIEENRSILSMHLASFVSDPPVAKMEQAKADIIKTESGAPGLMPGTGSNFRSSSAEYGPATRNGPAGPTAIDPREETRESGGVGGDEKGLGSGTLGGPIEAGKPSPLLSRQLGGRNASVSSATETTASPPAQSNSVKVSIPGGGRARGPRLTVQIPDGSSEVDSVTGGITSPRNIVESPAQVPQKPNSTAMVLPPPSPSAQTLLSAGAIGPPNPFARPPPHQNINGETPVSALPSRFLNNELLPSPNSFYPEWNIRTADSNTLPSPLNFTTPVVGVGPSFLRDDIHSFNNGIAATSAASTSAMTAAVSTATVGTSAVSVPTITTMAASDSVSAHITSGLGKRKSIEGSSETTTTTTAYEMSETISDAKRLRVN